MSLDYDDGDREHFYREYGTPDKRWPALRRSRLITWALIAVAVCIILFIFTRPRESAVDWHQFTYSLYATDAHSLCNALLVFDSLKRLGSRADRVLLYPKQWDTFVASNTDRTSQLLTIARDQYKVNLLPIGLLGQDGATVPITGLESEADWDASITKVSDFLLQPVTWRTLLTNHQVARLRAHTLQACHAPRRRHHPPPQSGPSLPPSLRAGSHATSLLGRRSQSRPESITALASDLPPSPARAQPR
jgi:hypothetical protein